MNAARIMAAGLAALALGSGAVSASPPGAFRAFSLKAAQARLQRGAGDDPELRQIAHITRIAGFVYDAEAHDIILVGQAFDDEAPITLDHFAVAIRSSLIHHEWPKVSIDATAETRATGLQAVRFAGHVEDSQYGLELLRADIVLKEMGLGLRPTSIWGVVSYFELAQEDARLHGVTDTVNSRFWFDITGKCGFATREGVFAIEELRLGVSPQLLGINGKSVAAGSEGRDELAERFAEKLTANYDDIARAYPEVGRLKVLFDLTALGRGIEKLSLTQEAAFWLQDYPVQAVATPRTYEFRTRSELVPGQAAGTRVTVEGGVEFQAILLGIRDGDPTAMKEAVLKTRPRADALWWPVPLQGWRLSGYPERISDEANAEQAGSPPSPGGAEGFGCSLTRSVAGTGLPAPLAAPTLPSFPRSTDFTYGNRLQPQRFAPNVGGVLLDGGARIEGDIRVDLGGGGFSFIVDGERADLAPEAYRRFVTALWAVYYTNQDPGISIDPIAPGVDKHLVRYIGKVVNTDLGRVMRETDYRMKKWAVGTEAPLVAGFLNVDALTARHGLRYLGASRRFWIVAEEMKFKEGAGMLLFQSGKMRVKTEYNLQGLAGQAEPADEAFAEFFTRNYDRIAKAYPEYRELAEYAKLVGLAQYLKKNHVPLSWFLLANQDLVLTEDSPGTVEALAKGSDFMENMRIEGGVDLGVTGSYVYDAEAERAIRQALARAPAVPRPASAAAGSQAAPAVPASNSFSFQAASRDYSVLPQHSLTSGKDRRGIRYQTDLAVWNGDDPALELVRYHVPAARDGELGDGWRLLVPYTVRPADDATMEFLNARIPARMTLENLITGREETLAFSTDRYSIAGYVPGAIASSQVVGLFLMSDGSFRLADKLGNEFHFDPAGRLTDMSFSPGHDVHFEYVDGFTEAVERAPYEVRPAGPERIDFRNARLPARMTVADLVHGTSEDLVFDASGAVAGYTSPSKESSAYQILAILADGSFQLLDRQGSEVAFDAAGRFTSLAPPESRRLVKSVHSGPFRAEFLYTIGPRGTVLIGGARVTDSGKPGQTLAAIDYQYDPEGRLAGVTRRAGADLVASK